MRCSPRIYFLEIAWSLVAVLVADGSEPVGVDAAQSVERLLDEASIRGNKIGDNTNEANLKSDDEQDAAQDKGLDVTRTGSA
jgi:hypothetical protein